MLVALGTVLAALREKNYDSLLTEPAPTHENVMQVLRESGRLRSLRVWAAVLAAMAGKLAPAVLPARIAAPSRFRWRPGWRRSLRQLIHLLSRR